jgi:hypothetical protein
MLNCSEWLGTTTAVVLSNSYHPGNERGRRAVAQNVVPTSCPKDPRHRSSRAPHARRSPSCFRVVPSLATDTSPERTGGRAAHGFLPLPPGNRVQQFHHFLVRDLRKIQVKLMS